MKTDLSLVLATKNRAQLVNLIGPDIFKQAFIETVSDKNKGKTIFVMRKQPGKIKILEKFINIKDYKIVCL